MKIATFDLDGVSLRFEAAEGAIVDPANGDDGVVAKSGSLERGSPSAPDPVLLNRAAATLSEAAEGARKVVELFAKTLSSATMDSVSVALGVKLQGEAGFVFVNSKAEASITVTATVKMNRPENTQLPSG